MSPEIKEMVEALKNEGVSYYQATVVVNSIDELSADERTSVLREFIPADQPPPATQPRPDADFSSIRANQPPAGPPRQRKRPMLTSWQLAALATVSLLLIGLGWLARGWYPPRPEATTTGQEQSLPTIVGRWAWDGNEIAVFDADGTVKDSSGTAAVWKCLDSSKRKYQANWNTKYIDQLQISLDGMVVVVKNNHGAMFTFHRLPDP